MEIIFSCDYLGTAFALLFSAMWILVMISSFEYMNHEGNKRFFYCFYLLSYMTVMAACFAGNFFTFYCCFEAMTVLSMPMVLHSRSHESIMAALKYLFYSMGGAFLTLFGFFLFTAEGYDLRFTAGGSIGVLSLSEMELFAVFLMIIGFGAKAGMFPLHAWLPTAHPVAPAPASAFLSGVITKVGVLGIIRTVFYLVGEVNLKGSWVQYSWIILSLITVFMGSMMAYGENVLKKRLAYSTVSQVSYILFGLSLLEPLAFVGALMHVVFHSIVKNTLFMSAGSIILKSGKHEVSLLAGLGKKMPLTFFCFTLVSITLIGIPPTSAFISKWYLCIGALKSGIPFVRWLGPAVLLVSALLTAGYLLTVSIKAYLPGEAVSEEIEKGSLDGIEDPGRGMIIPLLIMTVFAVGFGIYPKILTDAFSAIAESVFAMKGAI